MTFPHLVLQSSFVKIPISYTYALISVTSVVRLPHMYFLLHVSYIFKQRILFATFLNLEFYVSVQKLQKPRRADIPVIRSVRKNAAYFVTTTTRYRCDGATACVLAKTCASLSCKPKESNKDPDMFSRFWSLQTGFVMDVWGEEELGWVQIFCFSVAFPKWNPALDRSSDESPQELPAGRLNRGEKSPRNSAGCFWRLCHLTT